MSHKKFGPDRFSRFDVYWIQTDRQTNRQAKFIYRLLLLLLLLSFETCLETGLETGSPGSTWMLLRPACIQVSRPRPGLHWNLRILHLSGFLE